MTFTQELTVKGQRAISEELSEEELAIFDFLTKPEIKLSQKERKQVKATAREHLNVLKRKKLVLNWRKRQKDRAQVLITIEMMWIRLCLRFSHRRSFKPRQMQPISIHMRVTSGRVEVFTLRQLDFKGEPYYSRNGKMRSHMEASFLVPSARLEKRVKQTRPWH